MPLSKEDVISLWEDDKEYYIKLTEQVNDILKSIIRRTGLNARILARTKDDASVMKKLYDKGFDYYPQMTDKSAARVICKFKQDVDIVQDLIRDTFEVINEDNKKCHLDPESQGYKSIHFDIELKPNFIDSKLYEELKHRVAEIQVRTNCEDTWAEIYHDIGYKSDSDLNPEIKREFYCLAGVLEVADNCFSGLNERIMELRDLNEEFILNYLKKPFIQKVNQHYNREFSYKNIQILLPLLKELTSNSTEDFIMKMDSFLSTKMSKINKILEERKKESAEIPYLSQPEILLIFYLIENDMYGLIEKWEPSLYIDDLDKMCNYWGVSLQDYSTD